MPTSPLLTPPSTLEDGYPMKEEERGRFFCKCGRSVSRETDLTRHQRACKNIRPYACSYCGKLFTQKSNMKTHENQHTGYKPYNCKLCQQMGVKKHSWGDPSQLTRHNQRVHNVQPSRQTSGGPNVPKATGKHNMYKDIDRSPTPSSDTSTAMSSPMPVTPRDSAPLGSFPLSPSSAYVSPPTSDPWGGGYHPAPNALSLEPYPLPLAHFPPLYAHSSPMFARSKVPTSRADTEIQFVGEGSSPRESPPLAYLAVGTAAGTALPLPSVILPMQKPYHHPPVRRSPPGSVVDPSTGMMYRFPSVQQPSSSSNLRNRSKVRSFGIHTGPVSRQEEDRLSDTSTFPTSSPPTPKLRPVYWGSTSPEPLSSVAASF